MPGLKAGWSAGAGNMPVTQDIVETYRRPRRVVRRLLDVGQREDRALVMLMAGCALTFISQWPRLAREAHLTGQQLNPLLGSALMAWIFLAPLGFYLLAMLTQMVLRALGRKDTGYGTRLSLFWAFLATSPLMLFNGLVAGFIGVGPGLTLVGALWLGAFLWFWLSGLIETGRGQV